MTFTRNLILLISILSLFLGVAILNSFGYSLAQEHSPIYFKFHPATYLMVFALGYTILYKAKRGISFFYNRKPELIYLIIVLLLIPDWYIVNNTLNGLAYLADTLICAILFILVAPMYDFKLRKYLLNIVLLFLIVNSAMAIIEELINYNYFLPNQLESSTALSVSHRSTALQGHPLNNGLITSIIMGFIYICDNNIRRKQILIIIGYVGLICFGARGALYVITASFILHYLISYFIRLKKEKQRIKSLFSVFFIFSGGVLLFYLVFYTKFGTRLLEASLFDEGSAGVRIKIWDILNDLNSYQLLFGISAKTIKSEMENNSIGIIENFWLYWLLQFGLALIIPLTIALFVFIKRLLKTLKWIDKAFLIIIFFGVASTNNSLASDTPALLIFAICAYAFLPPILPFSKKLTSSQPSLMNGLESVIDRKNYFRVF